VWIFIFVDFASKLPDILSHTFERVETLGNDLDILNSGGQAVLFAFDLVNLIEGLFFGFSRLHFERF
jgi:hypothetical protein